MSVFNGMRLSIGTTVIPNGMIEKGSFSATPIHKISKQWVDGSGKEHIDYFPTPKMEISFNIRERNLSEQESICSIFQNVSNLNVTYFDDVTCSYRTGVFYMDNPTFSHKTIGPNDIQYNSTKVTLHEY